MTKTIISFLKGCRLVAIFCLFAASTSNGQLAKETNGIASDVVLRRELVGTWIINTQHPLYGTQQGLLTVASSGNFISQQRIVRANSTFAYELVLKGTWQIKDGCLINDITNTSNSKLSSLRTGDSLKIIRVDDSELVFKNGADPRQLVILKKK